MKQRIFGWISSLIGIVLALALIEVTAIVWLMIEDGHYTSAAELFERTQNTYVRDMTKGSACRYVDTLFPHPYLAFVHHGNPPCGLSNINNIGLLGEDFPTLKRTDRYVILLTGGSVASQLGQNAPPPAPRYLEQELNKRYASPNGKPFLVLNGGDGAWKEPQQLILFAMYAGSVDAVVTLDGFNEHYFFRPGTTERLERPLSNFIDVNPFVADENFGDAAIGWVMGRIAGTLANTPILGHSHAAYMVVRGIEAVAKSKDVFKSNKRTTLTGLFAMPEDIRKDPDLEFAVQLGLYQKYARGIEALAKDNNVRTAYFLQPAPAWGKELTEEEKTNAGDLSYRDLYRRIVAGMLNLRGRGLAVFDLGDLLKDEKGTIYADDIHFWRTADGESRGYRLMAARMGQLLAETWGLKLKGN
ncbi:MAG: hypothetical protein ACHQK9_09580 [Reyranellales bacterium]